MHSFHSRAERPIHLVHTLSMNQQNGWQYNTNEHFNAVQNSLHTMHEQCVCAGAADLSTVFTSEKWKSVSLYFFDFTLKYLPGIRYVLELGACGEWLRQTSTQIHPHESSFFACIPDFGIRCSN